MPTSHTRASTRTARRRADPIRHALRPHRPAVRRTSRVSRASAWRLALLALLWGSSFLWIKIALRGLSPLQITLVRLALGAAVLLMIVRARRLTLPRGRATWAHLTVAALLANAVPYWLFAVGEEHVASNLAGATKPRLHCGPLPLPWLWVPSAAHPCDGPPASCSVSPAH